MALATVVLYLLIRRQCLLKVPQKITPPPPLRLRKKKEFLKGCCHHPHVDNSSESKCKLRCGEILSTRFAGLKDKNKDVQMSVAI